MKSEFGKQVAVDLLIKPLGDSERQFKAGIDRHIREQYDRMDLITALRREVG